MSDHTRGPELPEVDDLFDAVVADVDARSQPTGPARAVRTARRRRTTVVAGLAVAVIAVGGVVGVGVVNGTRDASVAAPVTAGPSPTGSASPADSVVPARLTAESLDAASRGWVSGWRSVADSGVEADLDCMGAGPTGGTVEHYRAGAVAADHLRVSFDSTQSAGLTVNRLSTALDDRCSGGRGSYYGEYGVNRTVWAYGVRGGTVFLGQRDAAFTMFVVSGAPDPTDDQISEIADALMADLAAG